MTAFDVFLYAVAAVAGVFAGLVLLPFALALVIGVLVGAVMLVVFVATVAWECAKALGRMILPPPIPPRAIPREPPQWRYTSTTYAAPERDKDEAS